MNKAIKDYRRKGSDAGFRPGNVPVGLIKKMYGRSILAEEVNKIISESLYNYIKDNKIDMLRTHFERNDTETDEFRYRRNFRICLRHRACSRTHHKHHGKDENTLLYHCRNRRNGRRARQYARFASGSIRACGRPRELCNKRR